MSYATLTELQERLEGFFDQLYTDEATGLVDTDQAEKDLADATGEVNSFVAARYAIPVTAANALELLRNITLTLAEELAWNRGGSDSLPEKLCKRAANARQLLRGIANGTNALDGAAEKSSSAGGAAAVVISDPVFKRSQLGGW